MGSSEHRPNGDHDVFPGGATAGWWAKAAQLDLEARGVIARERVTPLRWHRTRSDPSAPG